MKQALSNVEEYKPSSVPASNIPLNTNTVDSKQQEDHDNDDDGGASVEILGSDVESYRLKSGHKACFGMNRLYWVCRKLYPKDYAKLVANQNYIRDLATFKFGDRGTVKTMHDKEKGM